MPTRGFILPGYGIPPAGPPGPQGEPGPQGGQGIPGPAGGNEITPVSATPFVGLLKGEDGFVTVAEGGVEYLRPEDIEGKADVGHAHTAEEVGAATAGHDHTGVYSPAGHDHDGTYSASGHDHAGVYATAGHNHTGVYAPAGAAVAAAATAVVPAAGWTGTGPWQQTVAVVGILATHVPYVDVLLYDDEFNVARLTAFGCVDRVVTANGSITLYCYREKPVSDINIRLRVVQ